MADSENRDYITVVETASAAGEPVPPMIIIKRMNVLVDWTANNIDDDTLFNTSDTEYSNDDLALDWLYHFIRCTRNKRRGRWMLLMIDGFESHIILEFLDNSFINFLFSQKSIINSKFSCFQNKPNLFNENLNSVYVFSIYTYNATVGCGCLSGLQIAS